MQPIKVVLERLNSIGLYSLSTCGNIGQFCSFLLNTCKILCTTRLRGHATLVQMEVIGVNSLIIVILTGTFAGAVLALQLYIGLKRFGGEEFIGPVVAFSMARELGPVLAGIMVTGRAGSAIAAEIGTMKITEQIDALKTLCINVWQYLIVPRIVAATIIMPLLTLFVVFFGIVGGYIVSVSALHINGEEYLSSIQKYLELSDIINGLIKSAFFGLIFSWVGCYKGFHTEGGSRGVGISTTQSVVVSSIMILIANYFLTYLLFEQ